ncbi:hypothetical protein HYPSUDRAFT_627129 [Hypholoma sublateritium FD-334 SS-4]|uniref:Uncharacterized protein n=1 Tax=Hypholoma sublateritium (strain FD-334 SS-4) TaxID=945553 RepID=A0A0D2PKJ2_HYPSF|nr:hypothetical protein HYPSUDRAFT_627129 [Hypholoma sublateritium FD-334 SS-4]
MLLNPPRATPSAPAQSAQGPASGPSSGGLASPPPTPAARPTPSSLNSHSSYAAVFSPLGAPNTTARIDHVLDDAVGPGVDWRARVPAPHLGLTKAQNRARAGALRAMLALNREEEERRARAKLDGRDDDDSAESGGDTAPAPTRAVLAGPRQPRPRQSRPHLRWSMAEQNAVRADECRYELPLPSHGEKLQRAGAEENGRDAGGAGSDTITAPTPPPASAVPAAATAPTGGPIPALEPPDVLLEEFCRYYGVNATDQARLARLEFEPGDEIETLPEEDWKNAGFTTLAWRRIIAKNNTFISDSRDGLWG